jgi:hypothetical protein
MDTVAVNATAATVAETANHIAKRTLESAISVEGWRVRATAAADPIPPRRALRWRFTY